MNWIWLVLILLLTGCSEQSLPSDYEELPFKIKVENSAELPVVVLANEWNGAIYDRISYQDYFYQNQVVSFVEDETRLVMDFGKYEPLSIEVTRDFNTFDVVGPYDQVEEPTMVKKDTRSFTVKFEGHSVVYYNISVLYKEGYSIDYAVALALQL